MRDVASKQVVEVEPAIDGEGSLPGTQKRI
jgi:hypothetical protein